MSCVYDGLTSWVMHRHYFTQGKGNSQKSFCLHNSSTLTVWQLSLKARQAIMLHHLSTTLPLQLHQIHSCYLKGSADDIPGLSTGLEKQWRPVLQRRESLWLPVDRPHPPHPQDPWPAPPPPIGTAETHPDFHQSTQNLNLLKKVITV